MAQKPKPPKQRSHHMHVVRGGYEMLASSVGGSIFSMQGLAWSPQADVCDAPDHLLILVEAAGIDPRDVSIYQRGHTIVLQGTRQHDPEAAQHSLEQVEIATGQFEKVFHFADYLDVSRIDARYQHGMLRLRIAKSATPPREALFLKLRIQEIT